MRVILVGLVLLSWVWFAHSTVIDTPPPLHIDSIVITGNEVTKAEIILRECGIRPGQWIDSAAIERARLRVTNLNLFNRVEVFPMVREDSTNLVIAVSEKLYIYPLPYATWIGPAANEFEYGFRYNQLNINGMNRTMLGSAWFGVKHGLQALYWDPWISGTPGIGILAVMQQEVWFENIANQNGKWRRERHTGIVGVSKRFTPEVTVRIFGGFQQIRVQPRFSLSGTDFDNMYIGRLEYIQDRRDLIELPHRGEFLTQWVDMIRFTEPWKNRYTFGTDMRQYFPIAERWTLSAMVSAMTVTGDNPPYLQLRFGETLPIRGINNLSKAGTFMAKGGSDLRYVLLPTQYWTWENAPKWIAKKVKNLKYGVSISGFHEVGQAWTEDSSLRAEKLLTGYGAALTFTVPYVNVLRLDCGFNSIDKTKPNFKLEMRAGL